MSLDGKTLCGTLRPLERAVHLLALVDHHTGYVLSPSRLGCRTRNATTSLSNYVRWLGVKQICQVIRARTIGGVTATETAYYITSLSRSRANAATLELLIRDHWGTIENGTHYVRDEAFGEDRCTIKGRHVPQNLAALNWFCHHGHHKITATLRSFTRNSQRLFSRPSHQN